jgi:hypothetical protein
MVDRVWLAEGGGRLAVFVLFTGTKKEFQIHRPGVL